MYEEKRSPKTKKQPEELLREERVTYDDYADMADDGRRYEIANGRLELLSSPNSHHQVIAVEMYSLIRETCFEDYIILVAPLDVILSDVEVRQPDLIVVHRTRKHIIAKRGIEGAPDIVVEILSPSNRRRDKRDKIKAYSRYGVPEYWIVDPETNVLELYLLGEDGNYELADLFEEDEPVASPRLTCLKLTMNDIRSRVSDTLEWV